MRVPPRCFRLAPLAENAIHQESPAVGYPPYVAVQRSVAHLTLPTFFWRSVQTFLVLLHTEAGGTPAFQSVAASRQASAVADIGGLVYRCVFRPAVFGLLRSPKTLFTKKAQRSVTHLALLSGGRLPTLRYRHFFGVPFKLFWFYYTQRRAGRPRSSPSPLCGELMRYNEGVVLRYDILPFQGVDK
jgi:hypothetical protein